VKGLERLAMRRVLVLAAVREAATGAALLMVPSLAGQLLFMFLGGAGGSGVAVNNSTKQETFMKITEFQPGFGFGAVKFRPVFLFETQEAFNGFVTSGWEAGANAMASAKTKTEGGALSGAVTVSKGVKMFQINDEGAIVGVSLTAAKYYKDKEFNYDELVKSRQILFPSFRRKPESSLFRLFWTPASAGVTI
jgi:lipid-binding SYLF domain-containing protein